MLGKLLLWPAHDQMRGVDGSESGDLSARILAIYGSLKYLTTAVKGLKLLSVHGKTKQMLCPMVI